jgi:hypothetical protein
LFSKIKNTSAALLFLIILFSGLCYLGSNRYHEAFRISGEGFRPVSKTLSNRRAAGKPLAALPSPSLSPSEKLGFIYNIDDITEDHLTDSLDQDKLFIEGYGLTQRLLGRRVMEDVNPTYTVVRLSDGSLVFADPDALYQSPARYATRLAIFRDTLAEKKEIPLLYVQAPQKYHPDAGVTLPDGFANHANLQADTFLQRLEKLDVDTLDLRSALLETGRYSSLFFTTDHHWTAEGAFTGWQALAEKLEQDYSFNIPFTATNPRYWKQITLEDFFLGSQGKRVGSSYAGLDDFEIWLPGFETDFSYEIPIQNYLDEGSFAEALLFPQYLENENIYKNNPYVFFSGGDFPFARMKNLNNPNGPTVVLLRDSFACPFAPFMALGCGELVTIDLRHFRGDLMEYISWVRADMVVVMYSPSVFSNEAFFTFKEVKT